jgi:hypothetical protein
MRQVAEEQIMDSVGDFRKFLTDAGWAVSEAHHETSTGPEWTVIGANGPHVLEARAGTQLDAWMEAVEQARALGMD